MSLFGNISILNQAMLTYQNGLNVSANNIANAATPGYSAERLNIMPLGSLADGSLQFGQGVTSVSIQRLRDTFLDNQMLLQLNNLGYSQARQGALQDLAAIFPEITTPTSTAGIQGALAKVSAAWNALAATPALPPGGLVAAQTTVRDSLDQLAQLLNRDARMAYDTQANLDLEVSKTITQINIYTAQIASLNTQIVIAKQGAQGQDPNTLLDAREQVAEKLSQLINVNVRVGQDGAMNVSFSGGVLVDHASTYNLKAIPSSTDPGRTAVGYHDNTSNIFVDVTGKIGGGELGGFIHTRDVDCEDVRLALDKIAYGMIQRSNEINRSAVDFTTNTTNHIIFTGTKASDIALDTILRTTVNYIGVTSDINNPGEVATTQGALQKILMFSDIQSSPLSAVNLGASIIDPTVSIASQIPSFQVTPGNPPAGAPGEFKITSGNNSVDIFWNGADSVNDVVHRINLQGGGAIFAVYDKTAQKMFVYSGQPMAMWDINASFLQGMKMSAVITSSAPINNSPTSSSSQVNGALGLNVSPNPLNLFTDAYPTSTLGNYNVKVNSSSVGWAPSNDLLTIFGAIQGANTVASGKQVRGNYNVNTQIVSLIRVGQTAFNTGILSAGTPQQSISVSDLTGNLTRVFNFDTSENSTTVFDQFSTTLGGRVTAEGVNVTQAQALVDQTTQLQQNESGVDVAAELAQARIYQRSYEASVRLQAIMDEMLNVLINHMGSSTTSSSTPF